MALILLGNHSRHQMDHRSDRPLHSCSDRVRVKKVTWKIKILDVRQVLIITQQPTEQNT